LRQWNLGHVDKYKKIQEFTVASKVYLGKKEAVYSIADAQLNLARIDEYIDEKKINDVKYENLKNLGDQIKDAEYKTELSTFKFKTPEEIVQREDDIKKEFATMDELSKKKLAVLQDDLAREEFREKLRQWNLKHTEKANKLHEFIMQTKTYLHSKDEVSSIAMARLNLARFREYTDEKKINDVKNSDFRKFGAELKAEEYKSPLSTYKYPQPDEIDRREKEIADDFKEIDVLANKKFDILNDDLEREEFKEKLRQKNQNHIDNFNILQNFVIASRKYLKTKEPVSSTAEAQVNLDRLRAYFTDKADHDIKADNLRALGKEIRAAQYKTEFSEYKFPNVKEIDIRENDVSVAFAELDLLSGEKDEVQDDHTDWLRKQAEKLELLLGEVSDSDDDDDDDGEAPVAVEVKERNARRKSVKVAVAAMTKGEYKAGGKLAILKDDLAREQFKQKLRRWNKQHIDASKALLQWIAENRTYLEKKEPVDSIAEAEVNLARLRAYETAKHDILNVNVSALRKLGSELLTAEYKTQWSNWKWETPDEVKIREDELHGLFQVLDKLSAKKLAVLEDDLAREQFREKLRLAAQGHLDTFNNIKAWVNNTKEVLEKKEAVASISEANNNLASFAAVLADKEDASNINVSSLKKQGAEILGAEYKTDLSSYVFPDPGLIKTREFQVEKDWSMLDDLAKKKKAVLDADLKRELLKEELRLSFANNARDFNRFAADTIQECKEAHFGFNLQEVKAATSTLEQSEKEHTARGAANKAAYEKVHGELTGLGVTENVYTKHTPETLNTTLANLHTALKDRKAAHATELKRQLDNDALAKDFATKIDTAAKRVKSSKEKISVSTKELEAQLADVEAAQEVNKKSEELAQVKEAQEKLVAAGVSHNPHTVLTVADLEVAFKQYELFLNTKKAVLEQGLEHKKLRGITPAQYAEINAQFKKYDKDNSGALDRAEFKACLYSLGEEWGKKQVQAIMDQHAGKQGVEKIVFDHFREFMISYFGVTDTRQNVLDAFKDIADDDKSIGIVNIVPRRMEVFTKEDLGFFQATAPKTEGRAESWEYVPFVDEVFAR
jgi:Ca2+-binding EF-hand superfamily protein